MRDIIKSIYFLGNFNFTLDGDSFKTTAGGILSILIAVTCVILSWFFGNDIYLRESPNFFMQEEYLHNVTGIEVNKTSPIFFAFKLESDRESSIINPRYFEFNGFIIHKNKTKRQFYHLKTSPCNKSHIDMETFEKLNLKEYMCFNFLSLNLHGPHFH